MKKRPLFFAAALLFLAASILAQTDPPQDTQGPQRESPPRVAPADLKPLLMPRQSEMHLVADSTKPTAHS